MKSKICILTLSAMMLSGTAVAKDSSDGHAAVTDSVIAKQRQALADSTKGKGFGPQSPRDLSSVNGSNTRAFGEAPDHTQMNLCNIHFHKNAEHKGLNFATYAGNGDGHGYQTGYRYSGNLSASELQPANRKVCPSKHSQLFSGDTIELHYVHSSAQVSPAPTLGACLSDSVKNPQLRVETQVFVLVNDKKALDFAKLTEHGKKNGFHQALNIPTNTGIPIEYAGSTTGPSYNEKGSPFQVSWSVRPKVAKVDINSVAQWCDANIFNEDHAHGVRNLVTNPDLLSEIK